MYLCESIYEEYDDDDAQILEKSEKPRFFVGAQKFLKNDLFDL